MINVDLQQLVQALDAETRRELEAAAERCLQRGGSKILVEDLLLGLLERRDGLLTRALQDAEVDAGELAATLQPRGEASESRNPVFSAELVQWLQDALLVANLELGQSQIEQAALRIPAVFTYRAARMVGALQVARGARGIPVRGLERGTLAQRAYPHGREQATAIVLAPGGKVVTVVPFLPGPVDEDPPAPIAARPTATRTPPRRG